MKTGDWFRILTNVPKIILLCKKKNDSVVELTLPEDSNIYASDYSLYLPDKGLLQQKLAEWIEEFESTHRDNHTGDLSHPRHFELYLFLFC